MSGWIKLHRQFIDWEWYDHHTTKLIFIHLLFTVNWKPTKWRGIELEAGETIKSLEMLASTSPFTVQNWRTAIKNLKSTGELTERKYGKHRILKVKNYTKYQSINTEDNNDLTGIQQGTNRKVTVEEEGKKEKKGKKREIGSPSEPTPAMYARDFFSKHEVVMKIEADYFLSKGVPMQIVKAEFAKFVNYWTELNKSGTKQRWEKEKTFEVRKRLATWFNRVADDYQKKSGSLTIPQGL